jgi:hypothetical protein
MLRIHIHHGTEATSFIVEGKLAGPWVKELERCWDAAISSEPQRPIMVKLVAVTFIDAKGRELLARMCQQGSRLVPTGCLMKAIVEEIEAEANKNPLHNI